jgi:hypothetical protein
MGKGKIHHPEAGGTGGFLTRSDSLAEEGQLEAVFMSLFIGEVTRGIPPLGLKVAMRSMIPRKLIAPTGPGTLPSLTARAFLGANQMRYG